MISAQARLPKTKILLNRCISPVATAWLDIGAKICARPPTTSPAYSTRREPTVKYVMAAEERNVPITKASLLNRNRAATMIMNVVPL